MACSGLDKKINPNTVEASLQIRILMTLMQIQDTSRNLPLLNNTILQSVLKLWGKKNNPVMAKYYVQITEQIIRLLKTTVIRIMFWGKTR